LAKAEHADAAKINAKTAMAAKAKSQKAEAKAVKDFEALKSAKEAEIATAKKMILEIDQQLAELEEKHAQEVKELANTEEQLELDKTFLANLKKKCSQTDAEFDKRVKDRMTEIEAVEDTIGILNSDEAFANFGKTVFMQIAAEGQETMKARMKVVSLLRDVAAHSTNPRIALLMTSAQLDAFEKVKAEIDKMVAELTKQQAEEVDHRDYCVSEMNENERDTAATYDKKAKLEAIIAKSTDDSEASATVAGGAIQGDEVQRAVQVREVTSEAHIFQEAHLLRNIAATLHPALPTRQALDHQRTCQ